MSDTIIALATPQGVGAIAVLRISGPEAIRVTNRLFKAAGRRAKNLEEQPSHTIHLGSIHDKGQVLDEVLVSLFVAPKSFTKENVVEISCHGSQYIVQKIMQLFVRNGVRLAKPGEFTKRAFLNGQFDLAQAEAVADLIASDSDAAHRAALHQMRGGFSAEIRRLREKLIHFASMIELELDFSEEDVEFANRHDLRHLIQELQAVIGALLSSFEVGNVIKNGVPTVIAGKPNAGKSTLLNALLNEEKAIVSDIPGTTRDFIEDELIIGGVTFRFIDTAGLRETRDTIEAIGVKRTREKMQSASLIIYLFDLTQTTPEELRQAGAELSDMHTPYLLVGNKVDACSPESLAQWQGMENLLLISAQQGRQLDSLKTRLLAFVNTSGFKTGDTVVTNARHYESLLQTHNALNAVLEGLDQGITGDFLAMDIRAALHHLGEITGEITTDDLLANIFSKFCIGK